MKRLTFTMLVLAIASGAMADDSVNLSPSMVKLINQSLPVCSAETKVKFAPLQHKLPETFTGALVQVQSSRQACEGQWLAISSGGGDFFMGVPWFLDDVKGEPTLEAKLKTFAWTALKQSFVPVIDRTRTRDGLFKVVLQQTTERGMLPLEGEIDPAGTVFFLGHFNSMKEDPRSERLKNFAPYVATAPVTGAAKPEVTVIEFSDFECPSCQHAAGYMKPLMEKYGDKVRYVRYDLPLMQMHPWAFSAAVAGRAVYRQKPELFWDYKKTVYENQDKLNTFTFDDFARGFAQDHDLDLKKYDADIASPELHAEILKGVGAAFANDVRATPTYVINGVQVDAGDGTALEKYVSGLLKK